MLKKTFLFITILLTACGPQFSTEYYFHPPENTQDASCISLCKIVSQNCVAAEERNERNCERDAERDYQRCMSRRRFGTNPKNNKYECISDCKCYRSYCSSADTDKCEEDYRQCYINCGGVITAATKCVAFCDEVQEKYRVDRLSR